jgi:hypothetical protein
MEFEEFKSYCQKRICKRNTIISRLCKTESKQRRCYRKWLAKQEKDEGFVIDQEWEKVREVVYLRDRNDCQLLNKLTVDQTNELYRNGMTNLIKTLDPAHYLRRNTHPKFKYLSDNIVLLNRQSHSWLDTFCHPLNGSKITRDEWEQWWSLILGKGRKENLDKLKNI